MRRVPGVHAHRSRCSPRRGVSRAERQGQHQDDSVRDVIERSGYRPFEGRRCVTIVDQADALERSAQNAFLKVLEEPPSALCSCW